MDDDFRMGELKLAFSYHIVNQILDADGVVAPGEARFFKRMFPTSLLERAKFVDESGKFTQRWNDACGEALLQLPGLPVADRQHLIETLFQAAMADEVFEFSEEAVMQRAARLLGLDATQYSEAMDRLITSEIPLDEPVKE
jgi:uncharacterized tellurite resistance protein B-like protein